MWSCTYCSDLAEQGWRQLEPGCLVFANVYPCKSLFQLCRYLYQWSLKTKKQRVTTRKMFFFSQKPGPCFPAQPNFRGQQLNKAAQGYNSFFNQNLVISLAATVLLLFDSTLYASDYSWIWVHLWSAWKGGSYFYNNDRLSRLLEIRLTHIWCQYIPEKHSHQILELGVTPNRITASPLPKRQHL